MASASVIAPSARAAARIRWSKVLLRSRRGPTAWVLEYRTIACHEDGRILYITGKCDRCGGFMRSGTSVPANLNGDELLAYIYRKLERFRR